MSALTDTLFNIVKFVISLGILIFLHEFGHFIVSKAFKIKVEEFGFGFPPRMMRLFKLGETEFTLNWIPFGAFVRPTGENDPTIPGGMAAANPWKRLAILVGGPGMNIITAVLVFYLAFSIFGIPDATRIAVDSITPNSAASAAGLKSGDVFVAVNSEKITDVNQLIGLINQNQGKLTTFTYQRGGQEASVQATPKVLPPGEHGAFGVVLTNPLMKLSPGETVSMAFNTTYQQAVSLISLPAKLLRGQVPADQARVVGPKGMYDIFVSLRSRVYDIMLFLGAISVALGITNLLPLPALDGGRIFFLLPELIFKKRIPAEYENMVHLIGFAALILLMVFITAQDFIHPIQIP